MALITNFSTLKTAVADYANRTTSELTDGLLEGFIQNGESRINRLLRVKEMEAVATITTDTDGTASLPSSFLQFKIIYDADGVTVPMVAPEALLTVQTGDNKVYTLMGGELYLRPVAAESLTSIYYKRLTALTSSNTTNWLLTAHPDIYLYASLEEFALWRDEEGDAAKYDTLLTRSIGELQAAERRDRYSGPLARSTSVTQIRGYRA